MRFSFFVIAGLFVFGACGDAFKIKQAVIELPSRKFGKPEADFSAKDFAVPGFKSERVLSREEEFEEFQKCNTIPAKPGQVFEESVVNISQENGKTGEIRSLAQIRVDKSEPARVEYSREYLAVQVPGFNGQILSANRRQACVASFQGDEKTVVFENKCTPDDFVTEEFKEFAKNHLPQTTSCESVISGTDELRTTEVGTYQLSSGKTVRATVLRQQRKVKLMCNGVERASLESRIKVKSNEVPSHTGECNELFEINVEQSPSHYSEFSKILTPIGEF